MELELKSKRGTLHLLGVEPGVPLFSAQGAVSKQPVRRGDTFRVMDADKPAWRNFTVTVGCNLPGGWSAYGCDPKETDMHHLEFLIPLTLTEG